MSEVEQIERQIESLPPEDLIRLRSWFLAFDARVWDQQIAADSRAGKLDDLVAEARADDEAGKALTPNVQSLRGLMRRASGDEQDYRRHLEEKYL